MEIMNTDIVRVVLTLRARDQVEPLVLNESYTVEALQLGEGDEAGETPEFDTKTYIALMKTDPEAGQRMLAEFHDSVADAVAGGQVTPVERLADALVRHMERTSPRGQVITSDRDSESGYVLTTGDINISGPLVQGSLRVWTASAVGTWGGV